MERLLDFCILIPVFNIRRRKKGNHRQSTPCVNVPPMHIYNSIKALSNGNHLYKDALNGMDFHNCYVVLIIICKQMKNKLPVYSGQIHIYVSFVYICI